MSYYLKESPLLQQLIHQMAECNEDDLSYELWRDVCINCLLYTSDAADE